MAPGAKVEEKKEALAQPESLKTPASFLRGALPSESSSGITERLLAAFAIKNCLNGKEQVFISKVVVNLRYFSRAKGPV